MRGLFEADGNANHGYVYWMTVMRAVLAGRSDAAPDTRIRNDARRPRSPVEGLADPRHRLRLLNASSARPVSSNEIGFISERKNEALAIEGSSTGRPVSTTSPLAERSLTSSRPKTTRLRKTMLLASAAARGVGLTRRSATASARDGRRRCRRARELARLLLRHGRESSSSRTISRRSTCRCPDNVTYVANGFISHNTISFLMDCDTTGIEPDFSLVKFKELVGGGQMTIVNRTVPLALQTLGYDDSRSSRSSPTSTSTGRSSARRTWPRSTCRCSTWRSASGRSRTWAT